MPARASSKNHTPVSSAQIRAFRKKVLAYYARHGRDLPWRKRVTPFRVLISEIMLQQTQVDRVIDKFREFLAAFPGFARLAKAPLPMLLSIWSGMGYNRRALALKKLAQVVVDEHRGRLPSDPEALKKLPGIGPYTAGAIAAFAFNNPVVFMDTNIRRVFIHEFFAGRAQVHDDELLPLVERALDRKDPSRWYNALMDYGTMLKKEHGNPNRRSMHYIRQSPFENSNRQVRGAILKVLVKGRELTAAQIAEEAGVDPKRVEQNLSRLADEGFLNRRGKRFMIQ